MGFSCFWVIKINCDTFFGFVSGETGVDRLLAITYVSLLRVIRHVSQRILLQQQKPLLFKLEFVSLLKQAFRIFSLNLITYDLVHV
ncbi:hypothetical protein V6N13_111904 [Hibiscus sabdariffa]